MGLFGPSKTELEERIDELEDDVQSAKENAQRAHVRAVDAKERVNDVRNVVSALESAVAGKLNDYSATVEKLNEPKIVWKATSNYIAKLLIPEGATVVHSEHHTRYNNNFHKKRADSAIVISFHDPTSGKLVSDVWDRSRHVGSFVYQIGEEVTPEDSLNANVELECASGIHFFCTKDEAKRWW